MNYLFIGRNGVFEPLAAAIYYLYNSVDTQKSEHLWGNLQEAKKRTAVFVDKDKRENNVYTLGVTNYHLIPEICQELEKVAGIGRSQLVVIPIQVKGENITALLVILSGIPIIGAIFNNWAKQWTLSRRQVIINSTEEMLNKLKLSHKEQPAAKPVF